MSKLSNKGQSLALFVVILPFLIMIGIYAVDASYAKYNKNKLNEITKMVIRYGMNHIDEEPYDEMVSLIEKNDKKIEKHNIKIDLDTRTIKMVTEKKNEGVFSSIIGKDVFEIKSSYTGYIEDEKIVIKEGIK